MFEPLVPAAGTVWEGCRTIGGGDVLEEVGYWWPPAPATVDPPTIMDPILLTIEVEIALSPSSCFGLVCCHSNM